MTTYVVGDIQGCYDELMQLLELVQFDSTSDELWLVGDLINRGPNNIAVMDFIMSLPNTIAVLGNHDLHFIAVALGKQRQMPKDTLTDLLSSPRLPIYIDYLRHLPLIHYDRSKNVVMLHAGLPPQLDIETCCRLAQEVETVLRSEDHHTYFEAMYGNEPDTWSDTLLGMDRLRCITNFLTRIRYCTGDGKLELTHKTNTAPSGYSPWFTFPRPDDTHILFGHWAALEGNASSSFVTALDTGCVWGRDLTALRLEDRTLFRVPAIIR